MRARVLALVMSIALVGSLGSAPPGPARAAEHQPTAPPAITGLCATDQDYLWTISSSSADLTSYDVEYSTSFIDWALPATLVADETGSYSTIVATSKDVGSTLSARWAAVPALAGSSSAPNATACAMGFIATIAVVQGGTAEPSAFDFTITGSQPNPPFGARSVIPAASGALVIVPAGTWIVAEAKASLPTGYLWKSITCGTDVSTDPAHPRMIVWVAPGETVSCTAVNHYGPTLSDTVAPGVNKGLTGFGTGSLSVPKGAYATYLVMTDPNLAGKSLQIWSKKKGGTWKLTATRTVAGDGSVHFSAKVSVTTTFQARFLGDDTYVASASPGRTVSVSTSEKVGFAIGCSEFTGALDPTTGKATIVRDVTLRVGGTIAATLCENGSTGFAWGSPSYKHRAIGLTSHKSSPPKSGLPGAAGTATWTFRALRSGTSVIKLTYSQPWSGGTKAAWTLVVTVHAK